MTTCHVDDLRCDRCGIEGRERWSEGGHWDQHEKTTAVENELEAVPSPGLLFEPSRRDKIVCRRCGAEPRTVSSRLANGPVPRVEKMAVSPKMTAPPIRDRIPDVVVSGGQVYLRVHDGPRLEVDVPLSRARALLLATELIGALLPPAQLGDDPALGQNRLKDRVA